MPIESRRLELLSSLLAVGAGKQRAVVRAGKVEVANIGSGPLMLASEPLRAFEQVTEENNVAVPASRR